MTNIKKKKGFTKAGAYADSVRLQKGLKVYEFCEILGISSSSYYDKRIGETKFTEEEKITLKKMGKLSAEEFYKIFFREIEREMSKK